MLKSKTQTIHITRREANFDKACEEAWKEALRLFGIDEAGHPADPNFDRATTSLVVDFKSYTHIGGMGGQEFTYVFKARLEGEDEEIEDEGLRW